MKNCINNNNYNIFVLNNNYNTNNNNTNNFDNDSDYDQDNLFIHSFVSALSLFNLKPMHENMPNMNDI